MEKVVEAQTKEHLELLASGWKPHSAYQTFEHKERFFKGNFVGHDLTPTSKLMVVVVK